MSVHKAHTFLIIATEMKLFYVMLQSSVNAVLLYLKLNILNIGLNAPVLTCLLPQ